MIPASRIEDCTENIHYLVVVWGKVELICPQLHGHYVIHEGPAAPQSGGRQEDGVAVWTFNLIAIYAVQSGPEPGTFIDQLLKICHSRYVPGFAEFLGGDIIFRIEDDLAVSFVVLLHTYVVTPLVGIARVSPLSIYLSPSIVVARLRGRGSSELTFCPIKYAG